MAKAQSQYALSIGTFTTNLGSTVEVYDSGWFRVVTSPSDPSLAGQFVPPGSALGQNLLALAPATLRSRVAVDAARVPRGAAGGGGGGVSLAQVGEAVNIFAPLVTSFVSEITAGRRNYSAVLAGQIARKQQQLLTTTDPAKRAQLEAEIAALQQQAGLYAQTAQAGMPLALPPGAPVEDPYQQGASYGATSGIPQSTLLWIGAGVAAVLVLASLGKK